MQSYEVFVSIICLATAFSYVNYKFIKWTPTIGIMVLSLVSSIILLIASRFFPQQIALLIAVITSIDFHSLLMDGMLGFLLFAGSIHIDAKSLKKERWPIIALATVGILISTFLVGSLLYLLFIAFHLGVEYIYCLLFAALISPTDPIAVLAILKRAGISKSLELKIAGESLFNDGVAVVVFLTILEVAQTGIDKVSVMDVSLLFLREAGGGLLYGLLIGYAGFYAISSINKYEVEVLITITLVMGGYMLADKLHISGPLAMVVAGITIGSKGKESGISELSKSYISKFWELIDDILNALLFMLIGFEMLVLKINSTIVVIGVISIALVLFSRWVSVALPVTLLRYRMTFERNAIAILTWGGLRGGLSVALALSLPATMHRDLFVSITYMVVIFSIVCQGLTIRRFYKWLSAEKNP
jgi:monovalent cation:H+ antiporter, CPA1 family